MDPNNAKWLSIALLFFCLYGLSAQPSYHSLAQDTIVTLRQFPRNQYLLDGKKLSLPVMRWFMSDYPQADEQIRLAALTNQLSITGYSMGTVFLLTGLFVWEDNRPLSDELFRLGGVGFAGGILFQILSQNYEKKAVRFYNRDIKLFFREEGSACLCAKVAGDRVGLWLSF